MMKCMGKMTMMYEGFVDKWNKMPMQGNGFLALGLDHPLNFQIGHSELDYKSLVIVDSGIVDNIEDTYAVKVSNMMFSNGGTALSFQLIHPEYEEEFLHLCWDMITSSADVEMPLESLIDRYKKWQKFLRQNSKEKLSVQMQKGLIGELLYLERSIEKHDVPTALRAWLGPEGGDQDFVFASDWAEVKTVAMASQEVTISSMQQLEQEMKGRLVVYVMERSSPGDNRITLNGIANKIIGMIGSEKWLDVFKTKLFLYGYRKKDESYYAENAFRLIERREYDVNEDFPKLIRKNTPMEISSCNYTLSLQAINKYRAQI